jgi:hypothetical protein
MYRKPFTLLDKLPTEYNGFALNTSWRVGVALTLLLDEQDFSNSVVMYSAFKMLYKDIDTIDVTLYNPGTACLVLDASTVYMLNSEKEWVELG